MSTSPSNVYQDNPLWVAPTSADPLEEVLASMVAGQFLLVVVHSEENVRARFLGRLVPALLRDHFRVIRTTDPEVGPFDLRCLMNQVIGPGYTDGPDAVEQFFATLTKAGTGDSQLALIIDNAHLLTDQALRYLDLLVSITKMASTSLQLLLLGHPGLWERLSAYGHLTADKVSPHVSLVDEDDDAALDAGTPEGPAPAPPEAEAPTPSTAPGPKFPLKVRVPESLFTPTAAAQTEPQGAKSAPPAPFGKWHGKSKTRSLAWATLVSAILIGGGLTAIRFQEKQPIRTAVMRDTAAQPSARGPGYADPAPLVNGMLPENAKEAALVPATPDAPPAVDPAGTGNPHKAEAPVQSERADKIEVPIITASTGIAPPAEKETGMDARQPGAAPASFEPQQFKASSGSSDTNPVDAVAPAQIATVSVAPVSVAPLSATPMSVVPTSTGPNAHGIEEPSEPAVKPKPDTAPTAGTGAITGQTSFLPSSSSVLASLLLRGNMLLADGDVVAARLIFERAAAANSGAAALAMGQTYDPRFLAGIGAQSVTPDPQRAMIWYQRASDLGSAEAIRMLAKLSAQNRK